MAEAIDALNRSLEIDDSLPLAHLNLTICYKETGEISMAIHRYEAALTRMDKKADARCELAGHIISSAVFTMLRMIFQTPKNSCRKPLPSTPVTGLPAVFWKK